MENAEKIKILQEVELFKSLPPKVLVDVANQIEEKPVQANEVIFNEGSEGDGLYVLVTGAIEIVKENKKIAEVKPYGFFGELALIDNAPRAASAIAKVNSELLFLNKETFNEIMNSMPVVQQAAAQVVIRYLRSYTK